MIYNLGAILPSKFLFFAQSHKQHLNNIIMIFPMFFIQNQQKYQFLTTGHKDHICQVSWNADKANGFANHQSSDYVIN